MKTHPVPRVSEGCPAQCRDTPGTCPGHPATDTQIALSFEVRPELGTPRTPGTPLPPERDHPRGICQGHWPGWTCAAKLHPRNVTRLCAECKLILRNERMTAVCANPAAFVTAAQARANIAAVFSAEVLP